MQKKALSQLLQFRREKKSFINMKSFFGVLIGGISDKSFISLPSSLEDCRLRTLEVHHEGWYVEPVFEKVEELAPAILEFFPNMFVGQKVMLLNNHGNGQKGKT